MSFGEAHARVSAFARLAQTATKWTGKPITFALAVGLILAWAAAGPFYGWSDSHSLFVNTVTTIITFLMVFVLQATQNRDNAALHAKLDEIIRTSAASNRFIGLDHLTDDEIGTLRDRREQEAQAPELPDEPTPERPKGQMSPWPEPWAGWWGL